MRQTSSVLRSCSGPAPIRQTSSVPGGDNETDLFGPDAGGDDETDLFGPVPVLLLDRPLRSVRQTSSVPGGNNETDLFGPVRVLRVGYGRMVRD
jgi:hypothetical protein